MAKIKTIFTCTECGGVSPKWLGQCPHCNAWNTLEESREAPHAGGDNDPIKRYAKGRKVYIPTQRPRNVGRSRTSFDGWSPARCDALGQMKRLRRVLGTIPGPALLTLYALVIHPSQPDVRALSLSAYCKRRHGHDNARAMAAVLRDLSDALTILHGEYGERMEERAA